MTDSSRSLDISTKLERIARLAREIRGASLNTLAHHMDVSWLREAYRRTRKDGTRGVDGQSAKQYEERLEDNLRSLLDRAKSGSYRAPPVRRVHIPKGDGSQMRPIGIPTFEDKVLQRAVAMVISEVYEQEFLPFSYGFRPGRSAHQALTAFRDAIMDLKGGWIVEVDIKSFFDTVDHAHLREILRRRIGDRILLRLIGKWLNAGVLEGQTLSYPDEGTPQGGVISPLLANIYLHDVFDRWFAIEVRPFLKGPARAVRYADDLVVLCGRKEDAERFLAELTIRFGNYGLTLHPTKTRLVPFRRPDRVGNDDDGERGTFDLLGFTHIWAKARARTPGGEVKWYVMQRTARDRFGRALRRIREWCRWHRHDPLAVQHEALSKKLVGHYRYFGVRANYRALSRFCYAVTLSWWKALMRRSQRPMPWKVMERILKRYPLPQAHITVT